MPQMHCMGTKLEIPPSGQICPRLKTNMVPKGLKCEIFCSSGSPNVETVKCEPDGWSIDKVYCSGTSTGLIVGLLVGGIIGVCILAYGYARWKAHKIDKEKGASKGAGKAQPVTRAAKIAARNDMMVTGIVSQMAIKTGVAKDIPSETSGKLITGTDEYDYRHHSTSSQFSNPPAYHSLEHNDERNRNSASHKSRSRRSRNSNSDHSQSQRKDRAYYDEYTEDVDLGFHENSAQPTLEGQLYSIQDNGPMYPDYYGPSTHRSDHRYGAMDHNYYSRDNPSHPDYYVGGVDNGGYNYSHQEKPYHVPI